jgi:hypothetical protein
MKLTKNRLKKIIQEESEAIDEARAVSLEQGRDPKYRVGQMIHAALPYDQIRSVLGIYRMDLTSAWYDKAEAKVREEIANIFIELAEQIKEGDKTS